MITYDKRCRTHFCSWIWLSQPDDFGSLKSCIPMSLGTALWVRMLREEFQAMGSQPLAGLGVECGTCFLTCHDLLLHANVSRHFWKSWVSWVFHPFLNLVTIFCLWVTRNLLGGHFWPVSWSTARKHKRKRRNNFFLMAGDPSQPGFSAPLHGFSFGVAKTMSRWHNLMNFGFDIVCQKLMSKPESWYSDWNGSTKKRKYSDICRWIADWNAPFDHQNLGSLPLQAMAFAGHRSRGG